MKNRVLITSVGRKVSLVKEFKKVGWYVLGQDIDPNAVALKFCDEATDYEPFAPSSNLVIPTRDAELKLGSHGCSDETIGICTDKFKFYKWCKANGFNTPEVYFVKPRISSSGKETECVWQELLEGEEYSIDLFSDFSGNVISVVPRKRVKVLSGESYITTTVSHPILIEQSIELSSRLRLVGHNVMQTFMVNGAFLWTDVNLRFGGASIVAIKAGCKSPEWYLKLINGEKIEPCIGKYQVGLLGRSYSEWEFDENTSDM